MTAIIHQRQYPDFQGDSRDQRSQATVLQSDKWHTTGKPTALMRELVRCVPPGGTVLDPFAGSGSTGVAAVQAVQGLHVAKKGDLFEVAA